MNLLAGCVGIVLALRNALPYAAYCVLIAALFDFFDGFVARLLKVTSAIGKDLDSLSDLVSFGVLPSCFIFMFLQNSLPEPYTFVAFALAVFSGIRLARFNNDERQHHSFIGLPTPACTLWVISLPFAVETFTPELQSSYVVLALLGLCCFLLVSPLKLLALKFQSYDVKRNWDRYLLLMCGLVLLILFGMAAFFVLIPFYVVLSIVRSFSSNAS